MKYKSFKNHIIKRTCTEKFRTPRKYKKYLEKDFGNRCCYCNLSSKYLTATFHIDHFIPKKVFKGKKDYLLYDYDNLMLACPKCNLLKGDKYKGDIEKTSEIKNDLFYNPVEIDYNTIFYRNALGCIDSKDEKGRKMIEILKLYRPVNSLGWLIEQLDNLAEYLELRISQESNEEKKQTLEEAEKIVNRYFRKLGNLFRILYT